MAIYYPHVILKPKHFHQIHRQENEAKNIEAVAYDARNTSNKAYLLARQALDDQAEIKDIIKVRECCEETDCLRVDIPHAHNLTENVVHFHKKYIRTSTQRETE